MYKEIFKLKKMLEENNIEFEFKDRSIKDEATKRVYASFGSSTEYYQICCPKADENNYISIIEGFGTYGEEEDKLEIMGLLTPDEEEYVVKGYLTAEEVFERIKKHLEIER